MSNSVTAEIPSRRLLVIAVMIIAMIIISFSGVLLRLMDGSDPWQINFYRALAFGSAIGTVVVLRHGKQTVASFQRVGLIGIYGGALLAMAGIAYLQALTNTTVANTLFTLSAIPFITASLAFLFLHEHLGRLTIGAMCIAAVGIIVMVINGIGVGSFYGNLMALLASFVFAVYAVIVRANREIDMLPALVYAGIFLAASSLYMRWGNLSVTTKDIFLCFVWGGLLSGFANSMFVFASRHILAGEVTLLLLLEFALGPIWVWLIVSEVPTSWTLVGGGMVIAAVALNAVAELRSQGDVS